MRTDEPEQGFALARSPEEVPTPLAIAAADFCRRAGRPSPPEAVRQALARLAPEEDEDLRALLEREPPARPLGPEALIDVLRGLDAVEASLREDAGYYLALAKVPRTLAPPREAPARSPDAHQRREAQRQEILAALAESRGDLRQAATRLGLTEEALDARLKRLSLVRRAQALVRESGPAAMAPRIRPAGTKVPKVRPTAPVPPLLPKRGADRPPRGRLVLGEPVRRELRELERPDGKAELLELLHSYKGNRQQLAARLAQVFKSPKGPPGAAELDALIARHGLRAEADKLEHDNLRFLVGQARGDLSAVAKRLKLAPAELRTQLQERGWWAEVERVRDRYRRELFGRSFAEQAGNLLLRPSYLRELRALPEMEKQVREEVERVWPAARAAPERERVRALAERLGVSDEIAQALIARFKLR